MMGLRSILLIASVAIIGYAIAAPLQAPDWTPVEAAQLADDDLSRHAAEYGYLDGINVTELRFSEHGFDWHLLRFTNAKLAEGPLWVVPHDDENAAFDAMIAAIKRHGGVGIAVNSGAGSARYQLGGGYCGDRSQFVTRCDPNRNFSEATPRFTQAIMDQWQQGQPVIALHTNMPGYGPGRGVITILDMKAEANGIKKPRPDGYFGNGSVAELDDPDSYVILPYRREKGISPNAISCRKALNAVGVHVWHERVGRSDGSLSNYIALHRPEIDYANAEAKREANLSMAVRVQTMMVDAFLAHCRGG